MIREERIKCAVQEINNFRRKNKNKWIGVCILAKKEGYDAQRMTIKSYDTWVQRASSTEAAFTESSRMDVSVKEFTAWLEECIGKMLLIDDDTVISVLCEVM